MNYLAGVFLLFIILPAAGQRNIQQEVHWLKKVLTENHVEPRKIDDTFSSDLFDKLLADFDSEQLIFTREDIAWLAPYKSLLDDDINSKRSEFFNRFAQRYYSGLERSERLSRELLASALEWHEEEAFASNAERAEDEEALSVRHRQWLKHLVLGRLVEMSERDSIVAPDFFELHVDAAVEYVNTTALRSTRRLLNDPTLFDNSVANGYLQAVGSVFDPHSAFFSGDAFETFMSSLSAEDFYFGFTLAEDGKGNVIISGLAPGGAAWKSGSLHVSDILLTVQWEDEQPVDLAGMSIEDINDILEEHDGHVMTLTVRSVDGVESQVTLKKERLARDEDVVQSFILEGEMKTGYIYLPDFYTRWNEGGEGARCANDVAKEIIKLKKEGIEGLILDLRFNGGGSLYEAAAMAGIFIDEGPLAMVSTQVRKGSTLKDMNRGTIYDGPLAIMVNGASASASEVLAGTIQDYNRGVIVGSRTYGKATGQNILPLNEGASSTSPKAGYVKVTTQKLYRVTGRSAQGRGVTPDVILPDVFMVLELKEERNRFALPGDSLPKNAYYKPLRDFDRDHLKRQSGARLANHPQFSELQESLARLQEMSSDSQARPLSWKHYFQARATFKGRRPTTANVSGERSTAYTVVNGQHKAGRLSVDDYARNINEKWMQMMSADIYLQETYRILFDHVNSLKKL